MVHSTTDKSWTRQPNDTHKVLDWVFQSSILATTIPQLGKNYRLQQFPLDKDPKESMRTLCDLVQEVNTVPPVFKTAAFNGRYFKPKSDGHLGKISGILCDCCAHPGRIPKTLGIITPRNTNLYKMIIENRKRLTTVERILVGCQMAYAVGQVLEAKKCHKDIRLVNIHIDDTNNATLGGYCSSAMNAVFARQAGVVEVPSLGSWDNMAHEAPELRPALIYTPAIHVFALGMVLYALATWSIPGRGMANLEISKVIQQGQGPKAFAPYPTDKDLAALADIALKCCAFNPAQRPSIEQVLKHVDDLHHRLMAAAYSSFVSSVL